MMQTNRIRDIYTINDGIFKDLSELTGVTMPWAEFAEPFMLDMAYFSRSANKHLSPIVYSVMSGDDEYRKKIAECVYTLNKKNWEKLFNTMFFEYNPIDNYDMTETESISSEYSYTDSSSATDSSTTSNTGTASEDNEIKHTGSDTDTTTSTISNDSETNNSVYGFNSSSAVDSDKSATDTDTTENRTITYTKNTTDTESKESEYSDSSTGSNTHTGSNSGSGENATTRELNRSGNIGVTTTQQMIESERGVWTWSYFDVVFADIDEFIALSIY